MFNLDPGKLLVIAVAPSSSWGLTACPRWPGRSAAPGAP